MLILEDHAYTTDPILLGKPICILKIWRLEPELKVIMQFFVSESKEIFLWKRYLLVYLFLHAEGVGAEQYYLFLVNFPLIDDSW